MRRAVIWLIIGVQIVLICFSIVGLVGSVSDPADDGRWRNDAGILAILVACFLSVVLGSRKRRHGLVDPGPATEIVFAAPAVHFGLMAITCILGLAGAALLFSTQQSPILLACIGVAVAFLAASILALRFMSGPAKLSLSPTGLSYGPFKCGPIDWRDIRAARAVPFGMHGIISLEIVDPDKYFARGFPKFGRNLGRWMKAFASPFVISPAWLQLPLDQVLDAINVRMKTFGRAETMKDNS